MLSEIKSQFPMYGHYVEFDNKELLQGINRIFKNNLLKGMLER